MYHQSFMIFQKVIKSFLLIPSCIYFFCRPVRPVQRPAARNRNDDNSPSYAKPSARQPVVRSKQPARPGKKAGPAPKPGANAKPKVDSGIKNKVSKHLAS